MRRITLLLAAILTVCSLNAQKGNKNEKVVNIVGCPVLCSNINSLV
jgi:hypothetical protein